MSRHAVIALNEGVMNSGIVENIIEISTDSALGLQLPENRLLWDCAQYPVAIGDQWIDGVFTREGKPLEAVPTIEEQMTNLKAQLDALILGEAMG